MACRIPSYVERILQGEKPGDLPVKSVTRQSLIINHETAREIGVNCEGRIKTMQRNATKASATRRVFCRAHYTL